MHLPRSSSNVPPLPSFLELLQNPQVLLTQVLLTFDHVQCTGSLAPAIPNNIWTSKVVRPSVRPSVRLSVCLSVKPCAAWRVGSSNSIHMHTTCRLRTSRQCATRQPDWPLSIHWFKTSWRRCFSFWTKNNRWRVLPVRKVLKKKLQVSTLYEAGLPFSDIEM